MTDRPHRSLAAAVLAIIVGLAAVATAIIVWQQSGSSGGAAKAEPVVDRGTVPGYSSRSNADGSSDTGSSSGTGSSGTGDPGTGDPGTIGSHDGESTHGSIPEGSHLRLVRLGVDAPITQVRAVDGVMSVPENPRVLGWWRDGAAPGDPTGSTVIVGHINYAGTSGSLSVLPKSRPGDTISLTEPRTTVRYRVAAVRTYAKTSGIPATAFATSGAPQLVLITCGGPFDSRTGNYEDNIVVYATPA